MASVQIVRLGSPGSELSSTTISDFNQSELPQNPTDPSSFDRETFKKNRSTEHFLTSYIRKDAPLSSTEIAEVLNNTDIRWDLNFFSNGIASASSNPKSSYNKFIWLRDVVQDLIALKWHASFQHGEAREESLSLLSAGITTLLSLLGSKEQKSKMAGAFFGPDPVGDYERRGDTVLAVRYPLDENGEPKQVLYSPDGEKIASASEWMNAQIDALGLVIGIAYRFANQGLIDLDEIQSHIVKENSDNHSEHILVSLVKYLHQIKFWRQSEVGAWEEEERATHAKTSSLGIVWGALSECLTYHSTHGWDALAVNFGEQNNSASKYEAVVSESFSKAKKALSFRVPDEPGAYARESNEYDDPESLHAVDSALVFALYELEAPFTKNQVDALIRTIELTKRDDGYIRYPGDPYLGLGFESYGDPYLMADTKQQDYKEAEWKIIDAKLAGHYFREFEESGFKDFEALKKGNECLKRVFSQIHPEDSVTEFLIKDGDSLRLESLMLPKGSFLESTTNGVPSWNSELYWTKSSAYVALVRAFSVMRQYEASLAGSS